jgi:hypothetical protein|tara:strand:- start:105 stop:953 length:849 start_codon:yes stop_codon:yes gene_type:complete
VNIDYIQDKINDQREKLLKHKLYSNIETIKDLQVFTENHIYAVWDFMSLLKALQIKLTCTKTPWIPNSNSQTAYLINEIVLAEETDINQAGERKSHYELYLDAMIDIGARTEKPVKIINEIANSEDIFNTIDNINIHPNIREFLNFTFSVIKEGKPHEIAAIFTFGRENLIPNMFNEILREFEKNVTQGDISKLIYYFERHIELDEDEHGPMALEMVSMLAENDPKKWNEIESISIQALEKRILLWDAINEQIENKTWTDLRSSNEETYSHEYKNLKPDFKF